MMRSTHAIVVLLALAAAPAAAQDGPVRRPPADTIRIGLPPSAEPPRAGGDSIRMAGAEEEEDAGETPPSARRAPGPFDEAAGRGGPFSVETSGRVAPRAPRSEVVYAGGAPARTAAPRDTLRPAPRDTARTAQQPPRTPVQPAAEPPRTAPPPRPASDPRVRTHTVSEGETFFAIARRYGVQPAQLRALNPEIDPDVLDVGDVLQLPAAARDSRSTAAAEAPSRPAEAGVPRGSRTHVVAAGETLFGIARRYGVSSAEIVRVNRMESDQVRIGQRLIIPPAAN